MIKDATVIINLSRPHERTLVKERMVELFKRIPLRGPLTPAMDLAESMLQYHIEKQNKHIAKVQQAAELLMPVLIEHKLSVDKFRKQVAQHDTNKLTSLGLVPYFAVYYSLRKNGNPAVLTQAHVAPELMRKYEQICWVEHKRYSPHHVGEHYGKKNSYGTYVVLTDGHYYDIAEMVADWMAKNGADETTADWWKYCCDNNLYSYKPNDQKWLDTLIKYETEVIHKHVVNRGVSTEGLGDCKSTIPDDSTADFSSVKPVNNHVSDIAQKNAPLADSTTMDDSLERFYVHNAELEKRIVSARILKPAELPAVGELGDLIVTYPRWDKLSAARKFRYLMNSSVQGMAYSSIKMIGPNGKTVIGYGVAGVMKISEVPMSTFMAGVGSIVLLRHTKMTPDKAHKLYSYVKNKQLADVPYDVWGAAASIVSHVLSQDATVAKDEVDAAMYAGPLFCSTIFELGFRHVGIDTGIHNVKALRVWPKDFLLSPVFKIVGAYFADDELSKKTQDKYLGTSNQVSTEAVADTKRQLVTDYICKTCDIMDPSKFNSDRYRRLLGAMTDAQFCELMVLMRDGKFKLHILAPNLKISLQNEDLIKAAKHVGLKLFHKLIMSDPVTGRKFLTDNEYMVLQLPIRRQQQFLDKKMSVPDNDKTIDGLTGQVTGDSRACSITNPEIQVMATRGLDRTLQEFVSVRGGNIAQYGEMKRQLEETGEASLDQLDPTSRTRSAVVAGVLLNTMMLENNL